MIIISLFCSPGYYFLYTFSIKKSQLAIQCSRFYKLIVCHLSRICGAVGPPLQSTRVPGTGFGWLGLKPLTFTAHSSSRFCFQ